MEIIHYHFDKLPSTNQWAIDHIESFDHNKITVVSTDEQTAGRGQFGRRWIAPKELNLSASFCLFIENDRADSLSITRQMASSVKDILHGYGLSPTFKWPNDLLIDGKKIAGVLTETVPLSSRTGIVIGVGLNINMPQKELIKIDQPATSILVETGKELKVGEVLNAIKDTLQKYEILFHHSLAD